MHLESILAHLNLKTTNPAGCAGGKWLRNDHLFSSVNPADGKSLAEAGAATASDYEEVVTVASNTFQRWRMVPAPKRGELVHRLGELLRANKDALGTLVSIEVGKIKQEGLGEVQEMIDICDFAVGLSRQLYGKTMHSERPNHRMYEQWHPLGPVGVISAFNFPVAVWAWNAMIAAVCGNTIIWKPSPKAPLTALAVQHLCNRAMQELNHPGVFSLLLDDRHTVGQKLAKDVRVPLISFTGSSEVGREVARDVAGRFGKYLLECAGNNAIIIDQTADLKLAVPAIVFGAVGTAGQRCTTTRRLLVHADRIDELLPHLLSAYQQVRIGDPLAEETLCGPLVDKAAVLAYQQAIQQAQDEGGEILCGNRVLAQPGFFVQPTIIRMPTQSAAMCKETFAPILYVTTWRTWEECIALHNAVPQGLSSAIFTDYLSSAERFLSHAGSDCGIANVNIGTSGAEIGGAFGGEKETGGGREAGSDSWQAYMRRQTNTINWGRDLLLAQGIRFDLSA